MNLKKYWKAAAGVVGSAVALGFGMFFGLETEQISNNAILITGAITSLGTGLSVILSPKNAE